MRRYSPKNLWEVQIHTLCLGDVPTHLEHFLTKSAARTTPTEVGLDFISKFHKNVNHQRFDILR